MATRLDMRRWDGDKLKILRQRKRLTQAELGEQMRGSVSQTAVCHWERGMSPSIGRIQELADILGVPFESLYAV